MIPPSTLEKLEFKKITEHISKLCYTELGKNNAQSLCPIEEFSVLQDETSFVKEANDILIKADYPPIEYLPDLIDSIVRANVEGLILDSSKFLDILRLLTSSRLLEQFFSNNKEISPKLNSLAQGLYCR